MVRHLTSPPAQTSGAAPACNGIFLDRTNRFALSEEVAKWSSVYGSSGVSGLWEQILEALNERAIVPDALQMIDSTVVRAHHQAAGAKGELQDRVLAAQEVALRPRSISASMAQACP